MCIYFDFDGVSLCYQLSCFYIELNQIHSERRLQKCSKREQEEENEIGRTEWMCLIILGISSSLNHLSSEIISPLGNYALLIYIIARDDCSCSTLRGLLGNRSRSQGSSQLVSVFWAVLLKGKAQKSPDPHYSVPCGPYSLPPLSSDHASVRIWDFYYYFQGQEAFN